MMILVIDGRYGTRFKWENFKKIFDKGEISPTHAEYAFAHATKMRMLVFIRDEVLTFYQAYRQAKKKSKTPEAALKALAKIIPERVDPVVLELVHEIKTTTPIPWIKAFKNVTEIKKEIQKKLLNELADLFIFKQARLESITSAFTKVLDEMPEEKRREALAQVTHVQEIINKVDGTVKENISLKKDLDTIQGKLKTLEKETSESKKKEFEELMKEKEFVYRQIMQNDFSNVKILGSSGQTFQSNFFDWTKTKVVGFEPTVVISDHPQGSFAENSPPKVVLDHILPLKYPDGEKFVTETSLSLGEQQPASRPTEQRQPKRTRKPKLKNK